MADLIFENPYLLLLLEHFGLDLVMHEKTVKQLFSENRINEKVFITFANLNNGCSPSVSGVFDFEHIETIIGFLRNSHYYFTYDKYPEIPFHIKKLFEENPTAEIRMIEKFFNDYFLEVSEHLDYEEGIAFLYFRCLPYSKVPNHNNEVTKFSGTEYLEHHTDIESKLTDLKNLLLHHVSL